MRLFARSAVPLMVALALLGTAACSRSSPAEELSHDASRDTIAGPRPTAPPTTDYAGAGISGEGTDLIKELREFEQEKDLCSILSSQTIKTLLGGELEVSGLVTSPSGLAQVLVVLDTFFQHLVNVSPPGVRGAMATVQNTWKQVTAIEPDALDREQRIDEIASTPEVNAAVQTLGEWLKQNCLGQSELPFDISGLAG